MLSRRMSKESPLPLYGPKHAKIEFHNGSIDIVHKYVLYFITKLIFGIFYNNAIAGVPRPGTYFLHIYFPNVHPIFCLIN